MKFVINVYTYKNNKRMNYKKTKSFEVKSFRSKSRSLRKIEANKKWLRITNTLNRNYNVCL